MADRTRPDLSDDRDGPLASSLTALAKAEAACTRCPLYQHATQVVPGEGPRRALILFVGEQPGDREDQAGRPFVGPAGKLFDRALQDAGIERAETFVTNAVNISVPDAGQTPPAQQTQCLKSSGATGGSEQEWGCQPRRSWH